MANDEVLAAAERLRKIGSLSGTCEMKAVYGWSYSEYDPDDVFDLNEAIQNDRRLVSDWATTHLTAEAERERMRAEPVTEAVLRDRFGFYDDVNHPPVIRLRNREGLMLASYAGGPFRTTDLFPQAVLKNIGQLEDLLSGLGIEPKREGGW